MDLIGYSFISFTLTEVSFTLTEFSLSSRFSIESSNALMFMSSKGEVFASDNVLLFRFFETFQN